MLELDAILLSRIQFAFTLSFHILFPSLTIGLAGYLLAWEIGWLKTGKHYYYKLCRFWTKIFALAFGIGVVSGLVLSYEFGTNFSKFSELTGNVIGPLMSYEVLTAFFLEAGFLGVMLFGWHRVSKSIHLFATLMVTTGTIISAFWILSANSWMQTPAGYRIEEGVFYAENWLEIIFNPSFIFRLAHTILASYLTTTFVIIGISAWYLSKGQQTDTARKAFSLALWVALLLAPLQLVIGDLHGLNTLKYQPLKIAAIEGHWETQRSAPLILFALPDEEKEYNRFELAIPHLGSLLLTHELQGEIIGLKSVAKEDRPRMSIAFFGFRLMVGIGVLFILISFSGLWLRLRHKLYETKRFLQLCIFTTPLGFVAILAGWFVTETGRQPWIVYNLLRTKDTASQLPAEFVLTSLIAFILLYSALLGAFIYYALRLIRKGPAHVPTTNTPHHLAAWLEKKP